MHDRRPVIGIAAWRRTNEVLGLRLEMFTLDKAYVDRLRAAGGLPLLLPHLEPDEVEQAAAMLDALILTGGEDVDPQTYGERDAGNCIDVDPAADRSEIALIRAADRCGVPILGICRGIQIINVAFGGTLHQAFPGNEECHGPRPTTLDAILAERHSVEIAPASRLARIYGAIRREVNTTHHHAVKDVAPGLKPVAWAPDGIIEALEADDGRPILAVQWHPEKLPPPADQGLFDALVAMSAEVGKSYGSGPVRDKACERAPIGKPVSPRPDPV